MENQISSLKDDILDYLSYIKLEKKLSTNTILNYQLDLNDYAIYLEKHNINNSNKITTNIIQEYLKSLKINNLSARSIARHITSIKEFHKYLLKTKKVKSNVSLNIESIKQTKKLPTTINENDMEKLLDINLENAFKYRDLAMIELMYGSGLRVSELVNLTIYSIDLQNDTILIEGKGKKERIVPINIHSKKAILEYLNVRNSLIKSNNKNPEKLFLNNHGKGITRQGFNFILKNLIKEKNLDIQATPHTLRHTFATDLLNNGADLRSIQELLGHTDIVTTRIYTHVANNKLKNDYIKYNQRNKE